MHGGNVQGTFAIVWASQVDYVGIVGLLMQGHKQLDAKRAVFTAGGEMKRMIASSVQLHLELGISKQVFDHVVVSVQTGNVKYARAV